MTAPVQPTLEGHIPPAKTPAAVQRAEDYETWLAAVRPAFEAAAATGIPFQAYNVAHAANLPEPPDSAHHWGALLRTLAEDGLITTAGWAQSARPTAHHSGVRTWRGTRTPRRAAA